MSPASEKDQAGILQRVAAGDRSALGQFYDQTAGILFSVAARILGSPEDAEEVIQDVFVQIWTKAATYDPALGLPLSWALRIARNRCVDRLRSRQRRSRWMTDSVDAEEAEAAAAHGHDVPGLTDSELSAVRGALTSLPADQKQAIEMAFFGGLTHQEIANELDEPLGTIKARIRRGMSKLRGSLKAYA